MYVVADASVFIWGKRPAGDLITVPAVEAELKDIRTRSLLSIFEARVESPLASFRRAAEQGAQETGDLRALSKADLDVLAKALEYRGVLATDDYALQNVALHLGLRIEPIGQPRIKKGTKAYPEVPGLRQQVRG